LGSREKRVTAKETEGVVKKGVHDSFSPRGSEKKGTTKKRERLKENRASKKLLQGQVWDPYLRAERERGGGGAQVLFHGLYGVRRAPKNPRDRETYAKSKKERTNHQKESSWGPTEN